MRTHTLAPLTGSLSRLAACGGSSYGGGNMTGAIFVR